MPPAQLERLRPQDLVIVKLHMRGMTRGEIARRTGLKQEHVSYVLNKPLVRECKRELMRELDEEFDALYGSVIDTIRDGLSYGDLGLRLKAVDRWLKANARNDTNLHVHVSAEDILSQALDKLHDDTSDDTNEDTQNADA